VWRHDSYCTREGISWTTCAILHRRLRKAVSLKCDECITVFSIGLCLTMSFLIGKSRPAQNPIVKKNDVLFLLLCFPSVFVPDLYHILCHCSDSWKCIHERWVLDEMSKCYSRGVFCYRPRSTIFDSLHILSYRRSGRKISNVYIVYRNLSSVHFRNDNNRCLFQCDFFRFV
jgi:hypothetical protein